MSRRQLTDRLQARLQFTPVAGRRKSTGFRAKSCIASFALTDLLTQLSVATRDRAGSPRVG